MSAVLVLVAVLLGLLALLAVPIDAAIRVQGIEAFKGEVAIRWLFGLVRFRVRMPDPARVQRAQARTRTQAVQARPKRRKRGHGEKVLAALRQEAFRRRVWRLVKDVARATHARQLVLRIRLGLGDPADTGRLWVLVGPLNAAAQNLRNTQVQIEPEFIDPVLEFDAHGRVLLVPLQILALAVVFALSPASIQAWRTLQMRHD